MRHQIHLQIVDLLADVERARAEVDFARGLATPSPRLVEAARSRLLCALEAYVAALAEAGLPVPYRVRSELTLCRSLEERRRFGR